MRVTEITKKTTHRLLCDECNKTAFYLKYKDGISERKIYDVIDTVVCRSCMERGF